MTDFTGKKYTYANGKRKTSTAQVRLYEKGTGAIIINGKDIKEYVTDVNLIDVITFPLKLTNSQKKFDVSIRVVGGGKSGQADACRLGISKCILKEDETQRAVLKDAGLLSRDDRKVERKKPGKRKARKSPQWSKR